MKRKSSIKRKLRRTRKRVMYGGQAAAPAPASSNIFERYDSTEVQTSLNNFVQAAYSVKLAADAIKATSDNQNRDTTDVNLKGTRFLQRDSAGSFSTATSAIRDSLDSLYRSLMNSSAPTLSPANGLPPLGWAPPPSSFSP